MLITHVIHLSLSFGGFLSLRNKHPFTMPLTKNQKSELKRITSAYRKMEKLSVKNGILLDSYVISQEFHFNDHSEGHRRLVFEQGRRRQEVFELSKQHKRSER
jgi:hypothetical protein